MHSDDLMHCRVCGLELPEPPWGFDGNTPDYDYCPCCGVEFGYQDATPAGARRFRAKWLVNGAQWASSDERPGRWDRSVQLEDVPAAFR
ncbi:hypothetical protein ACNI3K_09410 [Demequina sp. SO4-13]|uniref:hypothetical protein n=1 Tax=Demequina sp. SO4-13 TaxID=3401027 RepID=UPI003AF9F181